MFRIISRYNYTDTFEKIDSASSYEEALFLLNEYKLSFGSRFELDILEEKIKAAYYNITHNNLRIYDLLKIIWRSQREFVYLHII